MGVGTNTLAEPTFFGLVELVPENEREECYTSGERETEGETQTARAGEKEKSGKGSYRNKTARGPRKGEAP